MTRKRCRVCGRLVASRQKYCDQCVFQARKEYMRIYMARRRAKARLDASVSTS